jgi:Golgi nucleoside diphosphatase
MTTTKTTYTVEQTQELVAAYAVNKNVDELAMQFGKSVRSIISKLSREGVYEKKSAPAKKSARKDELVIQLELFAKVEMPSLKNMTCEDLL